MIPWLYDICRNVEASGHVDVFTPIRPQNGFGLCAIRSTNRILRRRNGDD
jgi:hypothetical protein